MRPQAPILVPVDLAQRSAHVLAWAAHFAAFSHAAVHVLHVLPVPLYEPIRSLFDTLADREEVAETIREEMTTRVENARLQGLEAPHEIQWVHRRGAHEATEILRYAGEVDAGLIVMGTHGHRALRHPGLGGVSGDVVRGASCPVLTVPAAPGDAPEAEGTEASAPSVRHVLVPVDFSPHAERAIPMARSVAGPFGASLSLLFVAEERTVVFFSDTGLPSVQTKAVDPDISARAGDALLQLFHAADASGEGDAEGDVEAQSYVRVGHPAREILRFADEEGVDLIVQSAHSPTRHALVDLGSVAERVVRGAPCPVLTLKGEG